jgi:hypothetical protein
MFRVFYITNKVVYLMVLPEIRASRYSVIRGLGYSVMCKCAIILKYGNMRIISRV